MWVTLLATDTATLPRNLLITITPWSFDPYPQGQMQGLMAADWSNLLKKEETSKVEIDVSKWVCCHCAKWLYC